MFSRAGGKAALWALLLLSTTVLVPVVMADHAYSHRYVIYGRVIDADGNPVPGLTVDLGFRDVQGLEGNCAQQPGTETDAFGRTETRPVTNTYGEFTFCAHVHSMSRTLPGVAILQVEGGNATEEITLDPYYRVSYATLQLPDTHPRADPSILDTTYTVVGRMWLEGNSRTHVEGIRVFGETLNNAPVNVTVEYDGKTSTVQTMTNNYGDFAVRVPVESRPTEGTVRVQAANMSFTEDVDPRAGATLLKAEAGSVGGGFFTKTTLYVVGGILATVLLVAGGWWLFRKAAERREAANIRELSAHRKRANR